jgi:hypothetical protein
VNGAPHHGPDVLVWGSDASTGNWNDGGDGSTVADAKIRHREGVDADASDGLEEDDHDADSESDAGDSICSDAGDSICSDDSEPSVGSERGAGDDPLDLVKIPVDAVPAYNDRVGDELAVEYVCQRRHGSLSMA